MKNHTRTAKIITSEMFIQVFSKFIESSAMSKQTKLDTVDMIGLHCYSYTRIQIDEIFIRKRLKTFEVDGMKYHMLD